MKFNPEFLEFLSGNFATAARRVLAERFQIPVVEIPTIIFDDEVPGEPNVVRGLGESETLLRVLSRDDGSPYAIRVNPIAIEAQANIYLAEEEEIRRIAALYKTTEQVIKHSLIQGAGFDVVVRSLLQVVSVEASLDDQVAIREQAKQKTGLIIQRSPRK